MLPESAARTIVGRHSTPVDREHLDALAGRILGAVAPLSFDIARSAVDVETVYRMRYECVIEMGWARPSDFPDGLEYDEYDDDAVHVVCRDADTIIGCLRLVFPVAGRDLPTERDFGIKIDPPGDALEGGRIVVPARHRAKRSHLVLAGLFARSWLIARERSFERTIATATPQLIELYRGLGARVTVIGPERPYWGEMRAPIEVVGAVDTLARLDPERRHAIE